MTRWSWRGWKEFLTGPACLLLGLHVWIYLAPHDKPNQEDSYKERIPQNTQIKKGSLPQWNIFLAKERVSTLYYYKNPKTLTNQGTHNFSQLWHSRVVEFSNLTFEGYLAGTTSVFSIRSSLFSVLRRCRFEHARTV